MTISLIFPEIANIRIITDQLHKEKCDIDIYTYNGTRADLLKTLSQISSDIIITLNPAESADHTIINHCVTKIEEGYDLVILSSYLNNKTPNDLTALGNKIMTTLINLLHGADYTDAMTSCRAYRKEIITTLGLDEKESFHYEESLFKADIGLNPLMSIRAAKRHLKIAEIPLGHEKSQNFSKSIAEIAAYLWQIFREVFFWK